jgi:hypothetical protein
VESRFFKSFLGFEVTVRMKRTRHQLAPAMTIEKIIDCAVAGLPADRLLIGLLEVVDVQHLAGAGGFGKARQQGLLLCHRHVLAPPSAARLRLERFEAAMVVGHVRAIDRAQRNAHRRGDRRLRHPAFTQQYHLDASALRLGYFPAQRRFQLLNLPFAAFAHPFPPNQFIRGKHIAAIAIRHPLTVKPAIQSALEVV